MSALLYFPRADGVTALPDCCRRRASGLETMGCADIGRGGARADPPAVPLHRAGAGDQPRLRRLRHPLSQPAVQRLREGVRLHHRAQRAARRPRAADGAVAADGAGIVRTPSVATLEPGHGFRRRSSSWPRSSPSPSPASSNAAKKRRSSPRPASRSAAPWPFSGRGRTGEAGRCCRSCCWPCAASCAAATWPPSRC